MTSICTPLVRSRSIQIFLCIALALCLAIPNAAAEPASAPVAVFQDAPCASTIRWSPDGRVLALGSNNQVQIRDGKSGAVRAIIEGHFGNSVAMEWGRDLLAIGQQDGAVLVYRPASNSQFLLSPGPEVGSLYSVETPNSGGINAPDLSFSPDGSRLLALIESKLSLWSVEDRKRVAEVKVAAQTRHVGWSADGASFVAWGLGEPLEMFDGRSGASLHVFDIEGLRTSSIAYSPLGGDLAIGGDDGVVRIVDLTTYRVKEKLPQIPGHIIGLSWHPKGKLLAISPSGQSDEPGIYVYDVRKSGKLAPLRSVPPGQQLRWQGESLLFGRLEAPTLGVLDAFRDQVLLRRPDDNESISAVAPDTKAVAVMARLSCKMDFLDIATQKSLLSVPSLLAPQLEVAQGPVVHLEHAVLDLKTFTFSRPEQATPDAVLSSGGSFLFVTREHPDGVIVDLKTAKHRLIQFPKGRTAIYRYRPIFSPHDSYVAVPQEDGVLLWDAKADGPSRFLPLKLPREAQQTQKRQASYAFSPDEKTLAALNEPRSDENGKGLLQVFELRTGRLLFQLMAKRPLYLPTFSSDSKLLAFGLGIYDARTGKQVARLPGQIASPISSDGKRIVVTKPCRDPEQLCYCIYEKAADSCKVSLSSVPDSQLAWSFSPNEQFLLRRRQFYEPLQIFDAQSGQLRTAAPSGYQPVVWLTKDVLLLHQEDRLRSFRITDGRSVDLIFWKSQDGLQFVTIGKNGRAAGTPEGLQRVLLRAPGDVRSASLSPLPQKPGISSPSELLEVFLSNQTP